MLWVGVGSIFTFIVFVILLTLGGGEFFKRFDVRIHKKEVAESATAKSTPVDREVAEPIKENMVVQDAMPARPQKVQDAMPAHVEN